METIKTEIISLGQIIKTSFENLENLLKDLMANKDQIKGDDKKIALLYFPIKREQTIIEILMKKK